ncbi:lasso peptide biosynthesis B2 protein [Jeotgalibacillus marinus]|uniref:Lasso peptide biosynthesis B2 protein n=1 Tax=Jeotgalibacillus marinus TaxID=86667 RepID=A0ABV3Q120_9BACL
MGKFKAFFSFNREVKMMLLESYVYLARARLAKAIPFSRVAPFLGEHMAETTFRVNPANRKKLASVSQTIHIMSRYTFWESQCLVKAIAAMKMLERRNIESTLYLGTGRDDEGKLVAHAWLRSGSYYITGSEGKERFTVVGKFAKYINL